MGSDFHQPEELLEELFLLRHELLISRTQAGQAHEIYGRLASLERFASEESQRHARDLSEQFDRVRSLADGESQFLFGVIELYQTRVTTKMTVAMERLAVIAAITLPVTAIASVYGMNVIVNEQTHWVQLVIVLAVMPRSACGCCAGRAARAGGDRGVPGGRPLGDHPAYPCCPPASGRRPG